MLFAFFTALIQGFVLVFHWVDISHKYIWRGHRSPWPSHRRGIVILEVLPAMRSVSTLPTKSCRSVDAGSSPAPGITATDPQTSAGVSEGSTKPLLQVQLGFLWENVSAKCHPRVVCTLVGQQNHAIFKQNTYRKVLKYTALWPSVHGLYTLGSR